MAKVRWFLAGVLGGATGVLWARAYRCYRGETDAALRRVLAGGQVIETAAGPVEYAEAGEGAPVLVIHGVAGGYDQGLLVGQMAGHGYRIIAPSRFGYVRTPCPADASPAAQADAYAGLLDALGISRAAIIGLSGGGPSSLQFALRHPRRCSVLVLLSAVTLPVTHIPPPIGVPLDRVPALEFAWWLMLAGPRPFLPSVVGIPPQVLARISDAERRWLSEFSRTIWPFSLRRVGLASDWHYLTSLPLYPLERIAVPTLAVYAADDPLVPASHGRHAGRTIPAIQVLELEDGGHLLLGHHDQVRVRVAQFLRETLSE